VSAKLDANTIVDLTLVVLAVVVLAVSAWTWLSVSPVAQQIVLVAITSAVVASVVLMVSALFLLVLRLRSRVARLEQYVAQPSTPSASPRLSIAEVITLTNVERRIINRLEESPEGLTQEDLRRTTGLSKSTLSVALTDLERKSLIVRQELGRTKMVRLIREVKH
jgi:uncharacterized membrane protein